MIVYQRKGKTDFIKEGHTMFHDDVLKDLKRKAYLEDEIIKLRAVISDCHQYAAHAQDWDLVTRINDSI